MVDAVTLKRRQLGQSALLALMLIHGAFAVHGQSQDAINATQAATVRSLEARIEAIEHADLPSRVRVMEDNMGEIKWLARGVFSLMLGQLVLKMMETRKSRG